MQYSLLSRSSQLFLFQNRRFRTSHRIYNKWKCFHYVSVFLAFWSWPLFDLTQFQCGEELSIFQNLKPIAISLPQAQVDERTDGRTDRRVCLNTVTSWCCLRIHILSKDPEAAFRVLQTFLSKNILDGLTYGVLNATYILICVRTPVWLISNNLNSAETLYSFGPQ